MAAAAGTSLLVILITWLAVNMHWWEGEFLSVPLLVGAAIYVPFSIAGYTLWLEVYRWLGRHTRFAFWIYSLIVLLFIPVVLLVDPIQMQRGHFTMGGGYTLWADALAGQLVMWSPVVFYEILRRSLFKVDREPLQAGP